MDYYPLFSIFNIYGKFYIFSKHKIYVNYFTDFSFISLF